MYEKLIESWLLKPNETIEQYPWKISESMLKQNIERVHILNFMKRYYTSLKIVLF